MNCANRTDEKTMLKEILVIEVIEVFLSEQ